MVQTLPQGLSTDVIKGVTVAIISERRLIDTAQIERTGSALLGLIKDVKAPRIVVSFRSVEYLSSTMINSIIALHNAVDGRKGKLAVAELDPELQKIFTLMKLQKLISIHESIADAVAAVLAK
jgi:anti-anti-sigma factor